MYYGSDKLPRSLCGLENDFHLIFDKRMAKVLVEMDVSKGLLADIDIVCGDHVINQRLDCLH